ncbi:MAG: hypothetical protein Q8Q63_11285 [Phaeovulum sp.]|uniref:hypothetical protein n=1 Tax=Phaeovulum sp. TaxID=2934796 RepID=UPI002734C540|nr:hypothetical protein [Phaeovulum sp.]MDP3862153.1 hypothetical protein [Phaeovulum sp.]
MSLVRFYLFALLCIPFYIGPEIAANVQINVERALLALLLLLVGLGILRGVVGPALESLAAQRPLILTLLVLFFFWRALAAVFSGVAVAKYIFVNELISNAFVFILFYGSFLRQDMETDALRIFRMSAFWMLAVVAFEIATGTNPFTALAPDSADVATANAAIQRLGVLRTKGTFEHPLTLGNFVTLLLPIFLFLDARFMRRRAALMVAAALIICGAMTGSRTTGVLMASELAFYFIFRGLWFVRSGRSINFGYLLWPLFPLAMTAAVAFVEVWTGHGLFEDYVRAAQIHNGILAIESAPWLGFGQGSGAIHSLAEAMRYGEGSMRLWDANLATIDNWYLSVLLASGYPGATLFVSLQMAVLLPPIALLLSRRAREHLARKKTLGLFAGLTLSVAAGNAFMVILSIFTLHPLHYIIQAWLVFHTAKHVGIIGQDRANLRAASVAPIARGSTARDPAEQGAPWT